MNEITSASKNIEMNILTENFNWHQESNETMANNSLHFNMREIPKGQNLLLDDTPNTEYGPVKDKLRSRWFSNEYLQQKDLATNVEKRNEINIENFNAKQKIEREPRYIYKGDLTEKDEGFYESYDNFILAMKSGLSEWTRMEVILFSEIIRRLGDKAIQKLDCIHVSKYIITKSICQIEDFYEKHREFLHKLSESNHSDQVKHSVVQQYLAKEITFKGSSDPSGPLLAIDELFTLPRNDIETQPKGQKCNPLCGSPKRSKLSGQHCRIRKRPSQVLPQKLPPKLSAIQCNMLDKQLNPDKGRIENEALESSHHLFDQSVGQASESCKDVPWQRESKPGEQPKKYLGLSSKLREKLASISGLNVNQVKKLSYTELKHDTKQFATHFEQELIQNLIQNAHENFHKSSHEPPPKRRRSRKLMKK